MTSRRRRKAQLNLWLDPSDKEEIQKAAEALGLTMTQFMVETAIKAAEEVPTPSIEGSNESEEVLTPRIRNLCRAAQRGGEVGWRRVGFELATGAVICPPPDIDAHDWKAHLWELHELLEEGEAWAAVEWFRRFFPDVVREIPPRRHMQFAQGAIDACRDQRV